MKPGYQIEQCGASDPVMIFCYNWNCNNKIGLACYYNEVEESKYVATSNLVAIFKIKYKNSNHV